MVPAAAIVGLAVRWKWFEMGVCGGERRGCGAQ